MTHLTRKSTVRDFPLSGRQLFELDSGPKPSGSAFRDEEELREAWEANRERILERYAFRTHDAGWRPAAFWYLVGNDPSLVDDELRPDGAREPARLRWLFEHDAFLPGELDAMRLRATQDPGGYAATAWRRVSELAADR
jgi:hypothetical protein